MNKIFRKLLLFVLLLIPINVFALKYEFTNPIQMDQEKLPGTTKIFIKAKVDSEDVYETGALSCKTTSESKADCRIEPYEGFKFVNDKISNEDGNKKFVDGETIGAIVVTNKTTSEVTADVVVREGSGTLDNGTISDVKIRKLLSNDATLSKITLSVGKLNSDFKPENKEYIIFNVPDTYASIKISYTCDGCTVKGEGGNSVNKTNTDIKFGLPTGTNETEVKVHVTSEDGNGTSTYTFKVLKGSTTYDSKKLSSLSVGEYELDPKFDKDKQEYTIKVPKKMESIESLIKYEKEDEEAKVKVEGAGNLDKDENEVKITVTNRSGENFEYKIKVIKEDENASVIEIIGYKDKKVSFMNVDGVREELGEEEFAKKYPEEWEKIKNGTYQFDENGNIIKAKDDDNNNSNNSTNGNKKENKFPWIIVVLIVVSLAIIGLAAFLIFRDPDKKKNKKGEEEAVEEEKKEEVITPIEETPELTPEQEERLAQIDTYDEEARLEADNTEPVVEEQIVKEETIDDYVDEDKSPTTDIDEALSDLMNTKEYNFKDKE